MFELFGEGEEGVGTAVDDAAPAEDVEEATVELNELESSKGGLPKERIREFGDAEVPEAKFSSLAFTLGGC